MFSETLVYVLVEDGLARETLLGELHNLGRPSVAAESEGAFWRAFRPAIPGCLIADVITGGVIELLAALRQRGLQTATIATGPAAEVARIVQAMQAGAHLYLRQPIEPAALAKALEDAAHLETSFVSLRRGRLEIESRLAKLDAGEAEVLAHLASGKQNKEIAAALDLSVRTIELRRASIFKKMQADSLLHLLHMALVAGLSDRVAAPSDVPAPKLAQVLSSAAWASAADASLTW